MRNVRSSRASPRRICHAPALALLCAVRCAPAFGACNSYAPYSGQTVTCDTGAPNPSNTGVEAQPGSTNVTVNVQPGAELNVGNNNVVFVLDRSTVVNEGTLRQSADFFDAISAQGTGAGNNVLVNRGTIATAGTESEGMFNSAAAVNMLNDATGVIETSGTDSAAMTDFAGPGGGTLTNDGKLVTSGDNSAALAAQTSNDTLVNNGTITTTGANAPGLLSNDPASDGGNALTNNGTIGVSGTNSHGIVTLGSAPAVVTNNGSITASGPGGLGAFFGNPVTFANNAGASIVSTQSNAIIASAGGTLANAGTITASAAGIFAGGPATIANSGTIASTGFIGIQATGDVDVAITNTGTIGGPVAAMQTGAGNDTFAMSAGSTAGVVDLGGGANAVVLTGGAIGAGIEAEAGPSDTLAWTRGGTIAGPVTLGGDNNTATLTGLTDANLAGLTVLASGTGTGTLTLDGTVASGASRFVNWTTINLANASQLTLDSGGLTLGNAGIGGGTLDIDATSTLFAGGLGDPAIAPAVAGQLASVNNAGVIDLTNGGTSTADALVITGNYVGQNGRLLLQSVLGADGSPSDKLVISQGAGSGNTTLGVTNVGGHGGATLTDGILVVQATNGATTTTSAFTLPQPLHVGAYVYYLFRGGVTAGTADNWYLRSSVAPAPPPVQPSAPSTPTSPSSPSSPSSGQTPTSPSSPSSGQTPSPSPPAPVAAAGTPPLPAPPPAGSAPTPLYRMEVPVYAEAPELARELTVDQLGTFHDRQGDQALLTESGALPAAWARAWGEHASVATGGAASPDFSGTIGGVQIGHDLYADASASGHRNHYGFFVGAARATGDVSGLALGFPGYAAGRLAIDSYSVGGYWTHVGPGGWYTDTVVMGSTLTIDPRSSEGVGATTHGHAQIASVEAGLPIAVLPNLNVEPQLQLIWQHESIDELNDGISSVSFHADSGLIGRLGVRLEGRLDAMGTVWLPYLRTNLWRYFGGTYSVTYAGSTILPDSVAATAAEFELGLVARFGAHGSANATLGYTTNVNGTHRETVVGSAGVRWSW